MAPAYRASADLGELSALAAHDRNTGAVEGELGAQVVAVLAHDEAAAGEGAFDEVVVQAVRQGHDQLAGYPGLDDLDVAGAVGHTNSVFHRGGLAGVGRVGERVGG